MPLVEQACREAGAILDRKPFWLSLLYTLATFRRTPVILVDGQLVSHSRVPRLEELRRWVGVDA